MCTTTRAARRYASDRIDESHELISSYIRVLEQNRVELLEARVAQLEAHMQSITGCRNDALLKPRRAVPGRRRLVDRRMGTHRVMLRYRAQLRVERLIAELSAKQRAELHALKNLG